jgi:hypothetical protein
VCCGAVSSRDPLYMKECLLPAQPTQPFVLCTLYQLTRDPSTSTSTSTAGPRAPSLSQFRPPGPQAPPETTQKPETDLVSEVSVWVWVYSVWVWAWAWAWPACTQGGAGVYALPDGVIRSDELTSAMPSGTPGHRPSAISRPARPGLLMAYISFALVLRVR